MNGASQDPMEEIFAMFRAESREHVNRITELLLALERGEVEEAELEELFRAAHSLKGSASTLGVNRVAEIAHAMEDVFGAVKRGEFGYDEKANTEILTALDAISALVEEAKPGQEEEDASVPVEAARVLCLLGADPRPEPPPSRAEAGGGRGGARGVLVGGGAPPAPPPAAVSRGGRGRNRNGSSHGRRRGRGGSAENGCRSAARDG